MKNKLLIVLFTFVSAFLVTLNVKAANAGAPYTDTTGTYDELKQQYEKNKSSLTKINVSTSDIVTLYGYSNCNGSSCAINYMGVSSKFEDALSKVVSCSNGEKYINYQNTGTGGAVDFMEDNKAKLNGDAYWSVDYQVTCTSDNSGSAIVELGSTSDSSESSSSSDTSNYNSSTTVNNEQTGVNTYFVVLGLVAIVSYVFMVCVKKYNLFKNI